MPRARSNLPERNADRSQRLMKRIVAFARCPLHSSEGQNLFFPAGVPHCLWRFGQNEVGVEQVLLLLRRAAGKLAVSSDAVSLDRRAARS